MKKATADELDETLGEWCHKIRSGEDVDPEDVERQLVQKFGHLPEIDDAIECLWSVFDEYSAWSEVP